MDVSTDPLFGSFVLGYHDLDVGGVTSALVTGLTANTQYYYQVRSFNGASSADSNTEGVMTLPSKPSAPGIPILEVLSQTSIKLTWADNSDNEQGFKIERSDGNDQMFNKIDSVNANIVTYTDNKGLAANTIYFYRVKAYNIGGDSDPSGTSNATTWPNAPTAPSDLQATPASETEITLTWSDNSNNETGFILERSPNGVDGFEQIAVLGANDTDYDDSGLSPNTRYYYQIKATNTGGDSGYDKADAFTLPTAPDALDATAITNSGFTANWTAVPNANKYLLDVSVDNFNTFVPGLEGKEVIGTTSHEVGSLAPETTYQYRVRAVNQGGESAYSDTTSVTVKPNPTGAPTATAATMITRNSFVANWLLVTGAISYQVYVSTDNFKTFLPGFNGKMVFTDNVEVDGLTAETFYQYRLRAINAGGLPSDSSNIIDATTLPNPPDVPVAGDAESITQTSFVAVWSVVEKADRYRLDVSTAGGAGFDANILPGYDAITTTETRLEVIDLTSNTTYYYRVRADNAGGESGNSNEVPVTTLPGAPDPPSDVVLTPLSQTEIRIDWQDNSSNEEEFMIEQSIGNDLNFISLASAPDNSTTFTVTGLNANTLYYYRLKAANKGGESAYTLPVSTTTLPNAPVAPTSLVLLEASQTEIEISWVDNSSSESNFVIERSDGNNTNFVEIDQLNADVTTYRDQGLSSLSDFFYRVKAINSGGDSGYTNELAATTLQFPPTLDDVDDLVLAPSSGSQNVNLTGISAGLGETQPLTVTAESDNLVILSNLMVNYTSPNASGTLSFDITPDVTGVATVTIRIEDDGPTDNGNINFIEKSFIVNVTNLPDLIVQNQIASPLEVNVNENINLSGQVRNVGFGNAAPSRVAFYLSLDQVFDPLVDIKINDQSIGTLVAAASSSFSTTALIPINITAGQYYVLFVADDADNVLEINKLNNVAISNQINILNNKSPEIIAVNFPESYESGSVSQEVGITATDDNGIAVVEFFHRGIKDDEWEREEIIPNGSDIVFTITESMFDEIGLEYYFEVIDIVGTSTLSQIGRTYLAYDNLDIQGLQFGSEVADYNIFALPLELDDRTVQGTLGDDLGPYNPINYRLFHYENNKNNELNAGSLLQPGKGYWMIVKDPTDLGTGAGHTLKVTKESLYQITLQQGWNQIGNPYNFNISWNDVKEHNGITTEFGDLRLFSNGKFVTDQGLNAFEGGFVFSKVDTVVSLPLKTADSVTGGRRKVNSALANPLTDVHWEVMFKVIRDNALYELGGVGMHENADQSKDVLDDLALPKFDFLEGVQVVFEHPEYFYPRFTKDIVPSSTYHSWEFTVESGREGAASISWDNSYFGQNDMTLVLYDVDNGKLINLRDQSAYEFKAHGENRFEVHYGTLSSIREKLTPQSAFVGKVFPNPVSNDAFKVPVGLPEGGSGYQVEVSIYSLSGRRVATLYQANHDQGFYDLEIQLADVTERISGMYILKTSVGKGDSNIQSIQRIIVR